MLVLSSRFAVILAFDVRIERDAQELADSLGVKIFSADIIYHLFDKFTAYREVSNEDFLRVVRHKKVVCHRFVRAQERKSVRGANRPAARA